MKYEMKHPDFSFFLSKSFKVSYSLSLSIFFIFFLIFFLPFGVNNYDPNLKYDVIFFMSMGCFFSATLLFSLLNEFIIKPLFIEKTSLKTVMVWSIWTLILIGFTNYFVYNILGEWHDFSLKSAVTFVLNCSTILIFPILGTLFFFRFKSLQKQFESVLTNIDKEIDPDQLITFSGQGVNEKITLAISAFIYAKSEDNYVELFYHEGNKLSKFLIRTSMSSLISSIDSKVIARCHRSYMVNLFHVKSIKGGSNDSKLNLSHITEIIPVSKSYQPKLMEALKEVKNFS